MSDASPLPIACSIPVAWGEMDAFQHVNNVVFLRWFETARIAFFERAGLASRMPDEGVGPILARTEIDYRRPVTYPDTVCVSVGVAKVGRSSITLRYVVTSEAQGGQVVAEGTTVIVLVDYRHGGATVPIGDALRETLQAFVVA